MSLLPGFEQDLFRFSVRAFHKETVPSDDPFDDSTSTQIVYDTEFVEVSGQKADTKESIAAGIEAGRVYMKFYSGLDLPEAISEKRSLEVWEGVEKLGDFNVRSRVSYRDSHVQVEADALNNQ